MDELALYHEAKSQYSYIDNNILKLRIRVKKNEKLIIKIIYANKYHWTTERYKTGMQKIAETRLFDYYQGEIDISKESRVGYIFELVQNNEIYYYSEYGLSKTFEFELGYFQFFQFPFANPIDLPKAISWSPQAKFYQIFVDRFAKGSLSKDDSYINIHWGDIPTPKSFAGGDLNGITSHLDYLSNLGINAIYLTPIFLSPSNHKYDIVDYEMIDPMFGDDEALLELISEAHKRNIRIVLDCVYNHCSSESKEFKDVLHKLQKSEYYNYFCIDEKTIGNRKLSYQTFGDSKYMPKLNLNNEDTCRHYIQIACDLVKKFGFDGYRLDVADEVSTYFWRQFHDSLKKINPDFFLIGENWHNGEPWLQGDQFDSIMNYSFTKACRDYFKESTLNAENMCYRLNELLMRNTDLVNRQMLNLLDSHDTDRFFSLLKEDKEKFKSALALMIFYLGIPYIYYGDEVGMVGNYDPDCRRCFPWNTELWDNELLNFTKFLLNLRESSALTYGTMELSHYSELLIIKRKFELEEITLYINNSDSSELLTINPSLNLITHLEIEGKQTIAPHQILIVKKERRQL